MNYLKCLVFLFCVCGPMVLLGEPKYTISEFDVKQLREYDRTNLGSDYGPGVDSSKACQFLIGNDIWAFYTEKYKDELTKNRSHDAPLRLVLYGRRITAISISKAVGHVEFKLKGKFGGYSRHGLIDHGFILSRDSAFDLGRYVYPYDINDNDQVVGYIFSNQNFVDSIFSNDNFLNSSTHAFLWKEGEISIIQNNARAIAINNYGDIVGDMRTQMPKPYQEAFIFTYGTVYSLLSLVADNDNWSHLEHASDINDDGQIFGYGYRGGKLTGFLLTPL